MQRMPHFFPNKDCRSLVSGAWSFTKVNHFPCVIVSTTMFWLHNNIFIINIAVSGVYGCERACTSIQPSEGEGVRGIVERCLHFCLCFNMNSTLWIIRYPGRGSKYYLASFHSCYLCLVRNISRHSAMKNAPFHFVVNHNRNSPNLRLLTFLMKNET